MAHQPWWRVSRESIPAMGPPAHEPLFSERYVIACPPGHRFEDMDAVQMSELDGEDYLMEAQRQVIGGLVVSHR